MNARLLDILADVLHCANSRPPHIREREFYALKELLLKRFGTGDGFDVQRIIQECWNCEGTGKLYMETMHLGQLTSIYVGKCNRCTAGVYRQFWVRLERYRLGRHIFHTPKERYYSDPGLTMQRPIIEGYIKHHDYPGHLPLEAALWLFLVFEPRVFWRTFGHIGAHRTRTPLCWLSNVIFWTLQIPNAIRRKFQHWKWRIQDYLDDWRGRPVLDDDELPF